MSHATAEKSEADGQSAENCIVARLQLKRQKTLLVFSSAYLLVNWQKYDSLME